MNPHLAFAATALASSCLLAFATCIAEGSPVTRRMLEPESGVEFALDERWHHAPNDGSIYSWNKNPDEGQLRVRFPMDIKPTPSSAAQLLEADLHFAKAKPAWKKEFRKVVKSHDAVPAIPAGVGVLISAIALERGDREFIQRTYYVTTPEALVLSVECTLAKESVGGDDSCTAFVKSMKLMANDERQRRRTEQALRRRLEDAANDQSVQCGVVLTENKEFRDFYPQSELQDIPRFELLASILRTSDPKNSYDVQKPPITNEDVSQTLQQVLQICTASPDKTYFDAVKAAWPIKLGVLVRLNTKSEK